MALYAEVRSKELEEQGWMEVGIVYYDDANSDEILLSNDFRFPPGTTKADAVTEIRAFGSGLKTAFNLLASVAIGEKVAL